MLDDQTASHPPRYLEDRLRSRIASAAEIRSHLLVLVHMVDIVDARTSRLPWLTEDEIGRRIENRAVRLKDVRLNKGVRAVLHDLYDLRMLDAEHGTYRINKLGVLHMWSHGTRLVRHNTHDWEHKTGA